MKCDNTEKNEVGSPARRRTRRILIHGLVGALAGYLVLHPLSMLIHARFAMPDAGALDFLFMSFSLQHLSMAVYFTALGGLIGMFQGSYTHRLMVLYERAKTLSIIDELTGLYNRRFLMQEMELETERVKRSGKPLCIMMIDFDLFKQFNDTYGHQAGDELLRQFGLFLKSHIRKTDIAARYGGEEFVVVMPETEKQTAYIIAERLRNYMFNHSFIRGGASSNGKVTLSIGIAQYKPDDEDLQKLLGKADDALYQAKNLGRNRICAADQSTGSRAINWLTAS